MWYRRVYIRKIKHTCTDMQVCIPLYESHELTQNLSSAYTQADGCCIIASLDFKTIKATIRNCTAR